MQDTNSSNILTHITVDPKWEDYISQDNGSIWIHRVHQSNIQYGKLFVKNKEISSSHKCLEAELLNPKNLKIVEKQDDDTVSNVCILQAPDEILTNILLIPRERHITCFDINYTNTLGTTGSSSGDLVVFEMPEAKIKRVLKGHLGSIEKVKFAPSGMVVFSASADMTIRIWCCSTGNCAAILKPGLDGTGLPSCSLDVEPGGNISGVKDLCFIGKGRNLLSLENRGFIRLWDVSTQICCRSYDFSDEKVNCMCISSSYEVPIVENECSNIKANFKQSSALNANLYHVRNQIVAVGTCRGVYLFDLKAQKDDTTYFITFFDIESEVRSIDFYTPLHKVVRIRLDDEISEADSVLGDDVMSFNEDEVFSNNETERTQCSFDMDNIYMFIVGCADGGIRIYDLRKTCIVKCMLNYDLLARSFPIVSVSLFKWPSCPTMPNDLQYGVIFATSDGQVVVKNLNFDDIGGSLRSSIICTGIDCESPMGVIFVPSSFVKPLHGSDNSLSLWTCTRSGEYFFYKHLSIKDAFVKTKRCVTPDEQSSLS